jgi:hypothetical protein
MINYLEKYLKYKKKYLNLKGGYINNEPKIIALGVNNNVVDEYKIYNRIDNIDIAIDFLNDKNDINLESKTFYMYGDLNDYQDIYNKLIKINIKGYEQILFDFQVVKVINKDILINVFNRLLDLLKINGKLYIPIDSNINLNLISLLTYKNFISSNINCDYDNITNKYLFTDNNYLTRANLTINAFQNIENIIKFDYKNKDNIISENKLIIYKEMSEHNYKILKDLLKNCNIELKYDNNYPLYYNSPLSYYFEITKKEINNLPKNAVISRSIGIEKNNEFVDDINVIAYAIDRFKKLKENTINIKYFGQNKDIYTELKKINNKGYNQIFIDYLMFDMVLNILGGSISSLIGLMVKLLEINGKLYIPFEFEYYIGTSNETFLTSEGILDLNKYYYYLKININNDTNNAILKYIEENNYKYDVASFIKEKIILNNKLFLHELLKNCDIKYIDSSDYYPLYKNNLVNKNGYFEITKLYENIE